MSEFNCSAATGVAMSKYLLPASPRDYLFFVEGKATNFEI